MRVNVTAAIAYGDVLFGMRNYKFSYSSTLNVTSTLLHE